MKYIAAILLVLFSNFSYGVCKKAPRNDFDSDSRLEVSEGNYKYVGATNAQCFYYRDVSFKNGHGQQAIVVGDKGGRCVGLYRVDLASDAVLDKLELAIKAQNGTWYKVDLSAGLPKSLFFDGAVVDFEKCAK